MEDRGGYEQNRRNSVDPDRRWKTGPESRGPGATGNSSAGSRVSLVCNVCSRLLPKEWFAERPMASARANSRVPQPRHLCIIMLRPPLPHLVCTPPAAPLPAAERNSRVSPSSRRLPPARLALRSSSTPRPRADSLLRAPSRAFSPSTPSLLPSPCLLTSPSLTCRSRTYSTERTEHLDAERDRNRVLLGRANRAVFRRFEARTFGGAMLRGV